MLYIYVVVYSTSMLYSMCVHMLHIYFKCFMCWMRDDGARGEG